MGSNELDDFLGTPFDYIITGGGTAGLVLAARLSEDKDCQVGVLEAGESRLDDPNVQLPSNLGNMLHNPEYDWSYHSTPQAGTSDRIHHLARGKLLGGSSGINYMAYVRPAAEDIDLWGKLGNEGWSWNELWPYYLKSQSIETPNGQQGEVPSLYDCSPESHGNEGPITTSFPKRNMPNEEAIVAAFNHTCQISGESQPWSGKPLGLYGHLSTLDHNKGSIRSYAAPAYLSHKRSNLKILTGATVLKILLEQDNGQPVARGLHFSFEGRKHEIAARREVILSCGTIGTPQILELSGIGDPEILRSAGVECLVPLPHVGNRLQEHPMTSITYALSSEKSANEHQEPGGVSLIAFVPYSSIVSTEEIDRTVSKVEASTHLLQAEREHIIARLQNANSGVVQYNGTPAFVDIGNGYANQGKLIASVPGHETCYTFHVTITSPVSRGSTHITSADPLALPSIDIGLLKDSVDVDLLAAGLELADRIFSSHPDLSRRVIKRVVPSPDVDLRDRDQGCRFVRDWTTSFNHMLGTCGMGDVVDEQLKVKGVKGLRIVDASVIPTQISGNIMATVYAVAEKGADIIKRSYTKPT